MHNFFLTPRRLGRSFSAVKPVGAGRLWHLAGLFWLIGLNLPGFSQSFQPAQPWSAGSLTESVAVGNFDGDGKADLVTANLHDNTVSVLLNNCPVSVENLTPNHGPANEGTTLTLITTQSHNKAILVVPPGQTGPQPIIATVGGQTFNALSFTYVAPAPVLTSLTPDHGSTRGGITLTLRGTDFGPVGQVTVGGLNAPVIGWTDTQLQCALPAGQGLNQALILTRADGQTATATFNYDAPVLVSLSPASGPTSGGTQLTLNGVSLGNRGASVRIGNQVAAVVVQSHSQLVVSLPAGSAGVQPVVVSIGGQESNALSFTYVAPAPVLTSLTPDHGSTRGGITLTLRGTDFGPVGASVRIGNQVCPVVSQSSTQLVVSLPAGSAGVQPVVVSVDGQESNALSFTYVAPVVNTASLNVEYLDGDNGQLTNNSINPTLRLVNTGTVAIPYAELTVRYWFTAENYAGINTWVDYAQLGGNRVKMKYVRLTTPYQGADGYVEYGFDGSTGNLAPNTNSGAIQSRFSNQNWTTFNEANDYSYQSGKAYANNSRITVYRSAATGPAQLIWGTEPEPVASVTKFMVLSENKNTTSTGNQISTYLKINNAGNVPVNYSDLTMRYWFTAEGTPKLNHWVDYAELGAGHVGGQFVRLTPARSGADTYLEFSFDSGTGILTAGGSSGSIQFRAAKADWSTVNEANDYSVKTSSPFSENTHITLYYKGQLVYGAEPASGARLLAPSSEEAPLQVSLLGNPVAGNEASVEIRNGGNQVLHLVITDLLGHELLDQRVTPDQAISQQTLRLDGLPAGMYLLTVSSARARITTRLIKQ